MLSYPNLPDVSKYAGAWGHTDIYSQSGLAYCFASHQCLKLPNACPASTFSAVLLDSPLSIQILET